MIHSHALATRTDYAALVAPRHPARAEKTPAQRLTMTSVTTSDLTLVDRVLSGDRDAANALTERLLPTLHKRLRWTLSRGRAHRADEVVDYTQEALLRLWDDDFRILRTWDPARGASLTTFVGLFAERLVLSSLRSGRRSAWREDPTAAPDLEQAMHFEPIEDRLHSREALRQLNAYLQTELNSRSRELFEALYVEDLSADQAAARFDMSLNALYSWRSRFRTQAARWMASTAAAA